MQNVFDKMQTSFTILCLFFFWCLVCFICHSQNTSFLTGLRLGSRSSQGGQPPSLAICSCRSSLASFILLAKSLAYSAASSLFFLVCCFFRAIPPAFVLQKSWSLNTLNLGCFSPRFLTVFV